MATPLSSLVTSTRRFVRDFPQQVDQLGASITNTATSLTISDTTRVAANWIIEVDYESILVQTISNSTTVSSCFRGALGSTAVSHAANATVSIRPAYSSAEIIDALNATKDEMYPYVYKEIVDTSLTVIANTYEYTVPNMPGTYNGDTLPIQHVHKVEIKESGDYAWRPRLDWSIKRATTPLFIFRAVPPVGAAIRVVGFGAFPDLSLSGDTVDPQFPKPAEKVLILGTASRLMGSAEAGRSRIDVGARDDRESANKPGNAITLANQLERRFEKGLLRAAMGPLPPHVVSVF